MPHRWATGWRSEHGVLLVLYLRCGMLRQNCCLGFIHSIHLQWGAMLAPMPRKQNANFFVFTDSVLSLCVVIVVVSLFDFVGIAIVVAAADMEITVDTVVVVAVAKTLVISKKSSS